MQKRLLSLVVTLLVISVSAMAQITTSGISGRVTSNGEEVIGATVTATHQPSGTIYRALTNIDGRLQFKVCVLVDLIKWKFPTLVIKQRYSKT